MLDVINAIDRQKVNPGDLLFVTLTYPAEFPTARASKVDLSTWLKRFERQFGPRWMLWKIEAQRRGAPHYHLLIRAPEAQHDLQAWIRWTAQTWHEIAGGGDPKHLRLALGECRGSKPCVEVAREWKCVGAYACKYMAKLPPQHEQSESWQHAGKWWGQRRADLAPVKIVEQKLTRPEAVKLRRLMRSWLKRQPTNRWYVPGKAAGPSSIGAKFIPAFTITAERFRNVFPGHGSDVQSVWERARPIKRRMRTRFGGGVSGYMPAALLRQMLFAVAEDG
jgi:hypothetical protein